MRWPFLKNRMRPTAKHPMFAAISISYIVHLESISKCERVRTRDKQCERKARTTRQTIDDFVIQMLSACWA